MKKVTREDILLKTAEIETTLDNLIEAISQRNWGKADRHASTLIKQAGSTSAKITLMIDS